jgi:poly(3-hydroxyalkanoate) depolymerase
MIRNVRVGQQSIRTSVRAGDPARPSLVLANGIGASLELLQPFVDEIDPDIGVIRFDVPGVGGSPLPPRPYRFTGLVRLLDRVLDQLGCDQVDMLGISWGGALAQQFALLNPRRCRRLVLASTATGSLMVPAGPRILKNMITPRRYRDPGYAVQIAANLYGGRLREDPELARRLLHSHLRLGPGCGYAYQLLAGLGWTSLPFLPLIRQQTLILAGSDDPIIPLVNARIMRRLLPHADLLIYDDGHLGLLTRAPELGKAVSDFLGQGWAGSSQVWADVST